MAKCPKCYREVSEPKKSKDDSGFYLVTYRCSECGAKFKLEEWID
jgi:transposase-like protein